VGQNAGVAAYVFWANIARRNLSKGQRAMLIAKVWPEGKRGAIAGKGDDFKSAETAPEAVRAFRGTLQRVRRFARNPSGLPFTPPAGCARDRRGRWKNSRRRRRVAADIAAP
jgi:hypothetical protein